jgi:hypothetical protein
LRWRAAANRLKPLRLLPLQHLHLRPLLPHQWSPAIVSA